MDGSPVGVRAAEIDGLLGLDLVTANEAGENGPSLSFLANRSGGSFFPETRMNLGGYIVQAVATADFNGDGSGDVAVAVDDIGVFPVRATVVVFLNDGAGNFGQPVEYRVPGLFPQCLETADVTGDGIFDLIVCHAMNTGGTLEGLVSVLVGQGISGIPSGTFRRDFTGGVGTAPTSVAAGLLDDDNHADLVLGDTDEQKVFILYGTGTAGLFEPTTTLANVDAPSAVLMIESESGLLSDVVVSSFSRSRLLTFSQTAPRTFLPPTETPLGLLPTAMKTADFDQDEIPDLLVLSVLGAELWLGTGAGEFVFGESLTSDGALDHLVLADLNGDGRFDVAASSLADSRVTVILNGADVPLTPTPTPTITSTPSRTATPTRTLVPTRTATGKHTATPTWTATRTRTPTATPIVTTTPLGPGDANCDGRIDRADLDAVIGRLFAPGCNAADVNGDGRVTAADVLLVLQLVAGS